MKLLKLFTSKNTSRCKLILKLQTISDIGYLRFILQKNDIVIFVDYREPLEKPIHILHKINKEFIKIKLCIEEIKDNKIIGTIVGTHIKHVYEPKFGNIIEIYKQKCNEKYICALKDILKISSLDPVILTYLDCDEYVIYKIEPYDFKQISRNSYKNEEDYQLENSFKFIIKELSQYNNLKIVTGNFLKTFSSILKETNEKHIKIYESNINFQLINNKYIYKSKEICKLMGYTTVAKQNNLNSHLENLYYSGKLITDLEKIYFMLNHNLVKTLYIDQSRHSNFWHIYDYNIEVKIIMTSLQIPEFIQSGICVEGLFTLKDQNIFS